MTGSTTPTTRVLRSTTNFPAAAALRQITGYNKKLLVFDWVLTFPFNDEPMASITPVGLRSFSLSCHQQH